MDESLLSIMEVREDLMVSPIGDSEPALRSAYFLKPIAKSLDGPVSKVLSSSMTMSLPPVFEPKDWPLVIHFDWRRHTKKKWVEWVDALQLRYKSVWKKVGIFEAIMSIKCSIAKDQNLCFGIAEKWCAETNTLLFPWGEATITLEDVMVLGGYPVVGDPVFAPLQSHEMREAEKKLILAREQLWRRTKAKASLSAWMDAFVNSGSEVEHEAFLATWLSMIGFSSKGLVSTLVFPIAVHLARGNPIALGPAVLASIYKDLTLLKNSIVGMTKQLVLGDKLELEVTLQSPFYLVQIWVWERFKNLQPQPRLINHEDPMMFRWHKVKALKIDNVRLALESAMEHFCWRPYVQYAGKFKVFYPENETLVLIDTDLDKEPTGLLVSFATCLRVSLLVGIQSTIKKYLPHRVAMQFGMDQDVPSCLPRFDGTKDFAWKNYCRPISEWWKRSLMGHQDFAKNMGHQDFAKNIVRRKRSPRSPQVSKANKNGNVDDDSNARKRNSDVDAPSGFLLKRLKTVSSGNSAQDGTIANESIDAYVPTCKNLSNPSSSASTAEYENVKRISPLTKLLAKDTVEPLMGRLEEDFEDANGSKESRLSSERVSLSGTQGESYTFVSGINVMDLEQRINRLETVIKKLKIAKFGHC
ncbi:hypothetical protein JHK86_023159 [Glycine max]|nr:hypothetical protein JHK86_023159 [Glycine max]